MNVLNGLLAIAAAAMVYYMVIPFLNPDIRVSIPAVKETIAESNALSALPQNTSQANYSMIGDQNLFHPERIIPPIPQEKKEEKAAPKPDVILYGTLITDQVSIAFVEDRKAPKTTPGRGKRQLTLYKGDQLSGYILRDIEANRIVLVKGEEKIVVFLEEGEKRKDSETSMSPATAGMMPGGPQPATFSASLPVAQPPAQKVAQPAPLSSPSPTGTGVSPRLVGPDAGSLPSTRRGRLEEIQRMKSERPIPAP